MASRPEGSTRADHPYLDWAVATRFAFQRPGTWVPLIVEFAPAAVPVSDRQPRPRSSVEAFGRLCAEGGPWHPWAHVPALFAQLANSVKGLDGLAITVMLVEADKLAALREDPVWRSAVLRAQLGPPLSLPTNPNAKPVELPVLKFDAPSRPIGRAVIGIIDQGIAFANARFRNAYGTRIEYAWQQEVLTDLPPTTLGREFTKAQIDAELTKQGMDEDAVYRALGAVSFSEAGYKPLARHRTHGTQVLDLAGGADAADNVTHLPIIAVDMPEQAIGDPAGSTLTIHALFGLAYILLRAHALRQPGETLPVVVNISYGPHEGPHDGSSLFEGAVDRMIDLMKSTVTPLQVVLAAGNSRQSRVHAAFDVGRNATRSLRWRLQPCGRTPSAMELWWRAGRKLTVTLRAPNEAQVTVAADAPQASHEQDGRSVFRADYGTPPGSQLSRVVLNVAPTEFDVRSGVGHAVAPSGEWTVEVRNDSGGPVHVKAWIRRGDTPHGRRAKGRQSCFDDAEYQRHDRWTRPLPLDPTGGSAVIRRSGTLSGIATGQRTVVVGGYRSSDREPAPYSSAGPHGNPQRAQASPTLLAQSERSAVRRGVLAAGTRSGARLRIVGTSAAAPQVARWLADQWIAHQHLPPFAIPPLAKGREDDPDVAGAGLLPPVQD